MQSGVCGGWGRDETREVGRDQIMKGLECPSMEIRLYSLGIGEPRMAVEQQSDPVYSMENGS